MEEEKVLEPIIFTHEEFGEIHTFWIDGNPYFIGKEVATKLGYKDTVNALKDHVKDKHKLGWQIATSGQRRNMTLISEAGLYTLILKSTLPAAEKFQDWVTEEVLPTMRQTDTSNAEESMKPLIFTHEEFGTVRMLGDWDNPEFCLADLCKSLDLRVDGVVARLKGDPITTGVISQHPIPDALGRIQNTYFVNEDGLYDVILDSRKPTAKKFRKWITSEVLPSLRKTGSYTMPGNDDAKNFIFNFGNDNMSAASLKKGCGEELGRLSRMLGNIAALNPAQLYLMNEATLCITGHYIPTLEKFTFANYYGDEKKE